MDENLIASDLTTAGDPALVAAARAGNRTAFGLLYFRHHAAAWRMACIASGFSPDAEVALIEGFTTVFWVLPDEMDGVSVRPYLLACVRQAALHRAGRPESPASRTLISPRRDGPGRGREDVLVLDEIVLGDLEHHGVRAALLALSEPRRSALWLSTVEAMTPTEVGAILDLEPPAVAALVAIAGDELREASLESHQQCEVRAGCRFAVDHLGPYLDGLLSRPEQDLLEAHVESCAPCRMRCLELDNLPATLAASVPDAPLLGGECQRHWMSRVGSGATDCSRRSVSFGPPAVVGHLPRHRRIEGGDTTARRRPRRRGRLLPTLARPLAALPIGIVAVLAGVALSLARPPAPDVPPATTPAALVSPVVRAQLPGRLVVQVAPSASPASPETPPVEPEALLPAATPIELVVARTPAEPEAPSAASSAAAPSAAAPPAAAPAVVVTLPPASAAAPPVTQRGSVRRLLGHGRDNMAKAKANALVRARGTFEGHRLHRANAGMVTPASADHPRKSRRWAIRA